MAPKRPHRPTKDIATEEQPTVHKTSAFFRDMIHNERFQFVVGIIAMGFGIYASVAFLSFFFTGKADCSILEQSMEDSRAMRGVIQNWAGLEGARLSRFLMNSCFGFASSGLLFLLIFFGLQLIRATDCSKKLRVFLHTLFWILWASFFFGFIQRVTGADSFFYWGGRCGYLVSQWFVSYIQVLGTLLVLLMILLTFLIATNSKTIPTLKRIGNKFLQLFKKRQKDAETEREGTGDTETEKDKEEDGEEEFTILVNNGSDEAEGLEYRICNEEGETNPDKEDNATEAQEGQETEEGEEQGNDIDLTIQPVEGTDLTEDENSPDFYLKKLGPYDPRKDLSEYKFPSLGLLKTYENDVAPIIDREEQNANKNRIVDALKSYGIEIKSIYATVGPTVTLYEIIPKEGIKLSRIKSLEDDIMMSLAADGIRIIAPMPGKGTVGIEVPNKKPQTVSMHSVIASRLFQENKKMKLPVAIGKTITNEVFMFDLAKTPHLLVAGATGQGKSVAINAIITSLLYKKHPAELKFVLIDPKMVEFYPYKALIHHYLAAAPDVEDNDIVITDCEKVINTLNSLVIEMENRYKLLMDAGVRNLEDYNEKFINRRLNPEKTVADSLHHRFLPYIVIIIDEYGDFIMQAGKQVETPIARITQKARAVGMHMILATQRPSVNIVTGVIKANIPTRIALRTQSVIDSRTVLDTKGAEHLIGRGDMLYAGNSNITRIQCAFVDTPEVDAIVEHIQQQQHYSEPYQLPEYIPEGSEEAAPGSVDMKRLDPMFGDVARYVVSKQEGSTSRLQRAFEIGYNRAGKLSDQLEAAGIVGPNKGPKGRDVLIQDLGMLEQKLQELGIS
ncbi:MAG TPA: cell division protein FtsK [Bacteroidales bacterium]|nr:cell division protein FtsK [Bacteroidales bacterium]